MAPHPFEVVELRRERDVLRPHALGGSAAAALVVIDEAERVCEPIELRQQVRVVEVRPAVDDDDRMAGADIAAEQRIHARTLEWHSAARDFCDELGGLRR